MASKNREYRPGNPEYDYWNDKNLYPSLRHDFDVESHDSEKCETEHRPVNSLADHKIGFGTVFGAVWIWILLWAPLALVLMWTDWIVQLAFWGGIAIVVLLIIIAFYNAYQDEKQRNVPLQSADDADLPWYKKYPPADVIKTRKK